MKCNKEFTSSERSLGGTLHQVSKAVWVQGQMNAFATKTTERIAGEVGVFLRDVRKSVRKQEGGQKKNATGDGGVKQGAKRSAYFDTKTIKAIQSIGRKSINDFDASDIQKTEGFARQYWKEMGEKSPFFRAWFGDWRANEKNPIQTADKIGDIRGVQKNQDTGWEIQVSGKVFNETKNHKDSYNVAARPYLPYINDIVSKAILLDSHAIEISRAKSENSLLMHSLYAVADIGKGPEIIKLYVEEMNNPNSRDTNKRAYQLQNIEKYRPAGKSSQNTASSRRPATGTIHTVADLFAAVKRMDANFNPNPESKVVNEDGTPKVVYHGTNKDFTAFQSASGMYWFSETEDYAEAMAYERGGKNVIPAYLSIKNPYIAKLSPNQFSNPNYEHAIIRNAKAGNHDGIILKNDTDNELVAETFYIVFGNTQIKSATDNIGTFDGSNPDIRYSREMDTQKALERQVELLKGRVEYWKEQSRTRKNIGKKADEAEVRKLGRKLLREYSSDTTLEEILPELQRLADQKDDYSVMEDIAQTVARRILEGSGVDVNGELAEDRKALKKYLWSTPINITESIKAGIPDFAEWKKQNRGLRFREDGSGTDVDSMWLELQDEFGFGMFPEDIMNPEDQVRYIADQLKDMREDIQNPYGMFYHHLAAVGSIDTQNKRDSCVIQLSRKVT